MAVYKLNESYNYNIASISMDVAVPEGKRIDQFGLNGAANGKLYNDISKVLEDNGLEMAGDFLDAEEIEERTKVYKDNEYEFFDESLKEDWRTGEFTEEDFNEYAEKMKSEAHRLSDSIQYMINKHPEYAELFDNIVSEIVDIFSSSYMNESLKEATSMSRKQMINYLERRYSKIENADRIEAILSRIYGSDDFPDDDPKEGMWANFTDEELRDAINSYEGYRKVELVK